jgi:hypothetical protein
MKVNLSLCLINYTPRHEDVWGSGGIVSPFLTSATDGGEWLASSTGHFNSGKRAPRHKLRVDRKLAGPQSLSAL